MSEQNEKLTRRLQQEGAASWLRLDRLKADVPISCIDGRQCGHTVGAPGGNMGEFILLLAVLEWYVDGVFDEAMVERFFDSYLRKFQRFYMHTDEEALERLGTYLSNLEQLAAFDGRLEDPRELAEFVRSVPTEFQELMLEALVMPAHVGCGHIKQILTSPKVYRVRLELAQRAMRVFFRHLWDGDREVDFVVLGGAHDEQAVVSLHTRDMITDETLVPAISPWEREMSLFVNHTPALRYMRWRGLRLFLQSGIHPGLEKLEPWTVILEVERLGERHFDETLSRLAPGLERWRVTFEQGRFVT
jgi:hypothetical protein